MQGCVGLRKALKCFLEATCKVKYSGMLKADMIVHNH